MALRAWARKTVVVVVLPLVTGFLSPGCVTTDVARKSSPEVAASVGRVEVAIFANPKAQKARSAYGREVAWRLTRLDGGTRTLLLESKESRFTLAEPAPGRYRAEVVRWVDGKGKPHESPSPHGAVFRVQGGQVVTVDFVLSDKRSLGWVVGLLVFLGAGAAIAKEAMDDSFEFSWSDSRAGR